jgi:hypothetical protein
MTSYFAYHGPKNKHDFDVDLGYGFSTETKISKVNKGDIVYIIQRLKSSKAVPYLFGKYRVIKSYTEKEQIEGRIYRLALQDITQLSNKIMIDEGEWGKKLPKHSAKLKWNNFKKHFCQQGKTLSTPLSNDVVKVLEHYLSKNCFQPEVLDKIDDELADIMKVSQDTSIDVTEKETLIKARRGQGKFRKNVESIESKCRLTQIKDVSFLIASHIKPWRAATNKERIDGNNGLLLSPHVDRLFDKGFISFEDSGELIVSKKLPTNVKKEWFINAGNYGSFNANQRKYLQYHRMTILK